MSTVDRFFSLGMPILERKVLCVTKSAREQLDKEAVQLTSEKRDKSIYDALTKAIQLDANPDGSIPNVGLIPPGALILCKAEEATSFPKRWVFLL